jgi:hypothetical protein
MLIKERSATSGSSELFNRAFAVEQTHTVKRIVAPCENLTLLGFMMGRRRRERNGGVWYGAAIQAGVLAIDS